MKYTKLTVAVCLLALMLNGCGGKADKYYNEGAHNLEEGAYAAAAEAFKKGLQTDKRLAESYRGLGIAYYEMGDYESAITMLKQSLQEMEDVNDAFTIDVYYYMAESYRARGELVRAIESYTNLLEYTHTAEAYEKRGMVYMEKGDTERGLKDFAKAVALDDSYEISWKVYSSCEMYGMEKDGRTFLEQALHAGDHERTQVEDYYYRGLFNYTLGYYDKAREELMQAVSNNYDDARLLLGKVYLAMNDAVSARSLYQEYLSRNEGAAEAYNGLALCAIAEKNYAEALQYIEQGLAGAVDEGRQSLLFNRIVVYEYMLDFEQAKVYMQEYLEAYPGDEEALRESLFLYSR